MCYGQNHCALAANTLLQSSSVAAAAAQAVAPSSAIDSQTATTAPARALYSTREHARSLRSTAKYELLSRAVRQSDATPTPSTSWQRHSGACRLQHHCAAAASAAAATAAGAAAAAAAAAAAVAVAAGTDCHERDDDASTERRRRPFPIAFTSGTVPARTSRLERTTH